MPFTQRTPVGEWTIARLRRMQWSIDAERSGAGVKQAGR
ncbi:hypothetical protein NY08_4449 [Rhodococcus sp. B7740]|nr:hypothetical protein NY08_4449 [Rhodococcus sp. B7740]